jgi:hypothetical protein
MQRQRWHSPRESPRNSKRRAQARGVTAELDPKRGCCSLLGRRTTNSWV